MNFGDLQTLLDNEFQALSQEFQGVAVACSGGIDSTALFHLIWQITKQKNNFSTVLFHVNFGLRGKSSDEDQRFCEGLANAAGVPIHLIQVSPQVAEMRSGVGVQEWARNIRNAEFDKFRAKKWLVATGHHLNDVAENVLLRAARGTGPGTMAGMRRFQNGIWRPFLEIPKSRLLQISAENSMNHCHDATNDKLDYSRNVIRHKVLPELESISPGCAERIAKLGLECQEIADSVRADAKLTLPVETMSQDGLRRYRTWIPAAQMHSDPALKEWIAHFAKECAQGRPVGLSRDFFSEFLIVLRDPPKLHSWAREISGGVRIRTSNGFLYVEETPTI